jgi:hypothetical protein
VVRAAQQTTYVFFHNAYRTFGASVKGRKMETPWVGMRMGARHEDRQIMKSLRTCLELECDLFE